MRDERIKVKSVVQINERHDPGDGSRLGWVGCFVLVTEIKTWGIQGFVSIPKTHDQHGDAYIRLKWDEIDYIGEAALVPVGLEAEEEVSAEFKAAAQKVFTDHHEALKRLDD